MSVPTSMDHRWHNPRTWTLDRFLPVLVFGLLFALAASMNFQSDTWWLLRTGKDILASGTIPTTDSYSATVYGTYWPNHEWLSEVGFYGLYWLGGRPLLVLVCAGLVALTWYGVYCLCDGPPRVRAVAVLLGVINNASSWSVRPQLISLALFVLVLGLLPHKQRHWWYVPLFLLWANIHAGVTSGGIVLGAAVLAALLRFRPQLIHWILVGLASGLVTILNPLGWRLWLYALGSLGSITRQYLQEWRAPSLRDPSSYPFFVLAGVLLVSIWRARTTWRTHRDWTLLLGAAVFIVLSTRSIRHTMFLDVLALPLITRQFQYVPPAPAVLPMIGRLHQATVLVLVLGAFIFVARPWRAQPPPLSPQLLSALRMCDGTLFNTYEWGGELIWFLPEQRVFIDNRQDPYPDQLFLDTAAAEELGRYQDVFSRYNVGCALVPVDKPLYSALSRAGWTEAQRDARLAVFHR